jgi:ribosomal protein S27AE
MARKSKPISTSQNMIQLDMFNQPTPMPKENGSSEVQSQVPIETQKETPKKVFCPKCGADTIESTSVYHKGEWWCLGQCGEGENFYFKP